MAPANVMPTSGARVRRARWDAGRGGGQSDLVAAPAEVVVVRVGADEIAGRALMQNYVLMPRLWEKAAD